MRRLHRFVTILAVVTLCFAAAMPVAAGSTTKSLSTNFTLVNLGDAGATGTIEYYMPDGSAWGSGSESFSITDPGGQAIFRQYFASGTPGNPGLTDGSGSVVVYADQPLGAVVQILARNQDPTSAGAYSGVSSGGASFYVPLVARMLNTASGLANSQIIAQNTGTESVEVAFALINPDGSARHTYTSTIAVGAAYTYDLADEIATNVPSNWYGSAVISVVGTGEIAVVSNYFTGDSLQTFNAFPASNAGTKWHVPLFTSRLSNTLSTPLAVQNISDTTIPIGGVTVTFYPDPALGGSPFTLSNPVAIAPSGAYYWNPVVDMSIPAGFYGAAVVEAPVEVVAFVQMRILNTGEAAAYEAILDGTGGNKVTVPLVAKRLSNGFATAVTIQNLTDQVATVNLQYIPGSSEFSEVNITGIEIQPGRSLIQNHRVAVPELPSGWYGSLVVTSDQDIHAFVQLTSMKSINPGVASGDNFMAHTAFAQNVAP